MLFGVLSRGKKFIKIVCSDWQYIIYICIILSIYLKYLEFKKLVNFVDNTSILVIGKVMVEETSYAVEGT